MEPQPDREVLLSKTGCRSYSWTTTAVIKREVPNAYGQPLLKERFTVEAAALKLIAEKTCIPVPRLIAAGEDENGLCFLKTELIRGSVNGTMAAENCRMPQVHDPPLDGSPCAACEAIVRANAERFVRDVVLPELSKLESDTTGLEGLVIPPRWVEEHDKEGGMAGAAFPSSRLCLLPQ